MATFQFVDSIAASPVVRLDLNSALGGLMVGAGFDLSPPPVRRSAVDSMLVDGELIPAWVYGNRTLTIPVQVLESNVDAAATKLQALGRELARDRNILRVQLGTVPYFFRTYAAPDYGFAMSKLAAENGRATLEIPAEPFAYGLREDIGPAIIYNDPSEGTTLNSNPFFETNAANWTPGGSATFVRSTAQFHEGVASGLLTPDGVSASGQVESERVNVQALASYRAASWVRCAASRNIDVFISWFDSGGSFISSSSTAVAVTLNTWTFIEHAAAAPANAVQASMAVILGSTPPAGHTTHIDEARIRQVGGSGGACLDVTGVKGDVETPLLLRFDHTDVAGSVSAVAVRRRGTPAAAPVGLQAEAMTLGTDTTLPGNDPVMSGTGSNYARISFATVATMTTRLQLTVWPLAPTVDARGTYRVLMRYRKTVSGDSILARLKWRDGDIINPTVTLPSGTMRLWVDLGDVSIPGAPDPVHDGYSGTELPARGVGVYLEAQRASGSGNLDIDCLLFLPADDRLALVTWPVTSGPDYAYLDGITRKVWTGMTSGAVHNAEEIPRVGGSGFPMLSPGATNRIWFVKNAGTTTNSDVIGDQIDVRLTYYPRYLYLRPVST